MSTFQGAWEFLKGLPGKAVSQYEAGKGALSPYMNRASRLYGVNQLSGIKNNLNSAWGMRGLPQMSDRFGRSAGKGITNWASGADFAGQNWKRGAAIGARLGTPAAGLGLGAWGINKALD
jgi:hypothetical protein